MNDHPVLGQVALGYSPMIDKHRAITALRLTVFPMRPDVTPDAVHLLEALGETWPADAGRVSLNIVGESLLQGLMQAELPTNLMVEVPAFMAADPVHSEALQTLYKRGNTLLVKGRPTAPLPREVLPCFAYSIIDLADERRDGLPPPGGVSRTIPHVQAGVRTLVEMTEAFGRGAIAVLGWPIDDAVASRSKAAGQPQMQTIVELINRVDREESGDRMEAVLRNDPTLAFKLMRYINSPAFGLSVEISSFRHALMILGYQRLKRWLALLLASSSRDPDLRPVIFAAVRRGLLMEELGRASGADDEHRSELFICGVFSLLDRMMGQPFAQLLASIPVPEAVRSALADGAGPHHPYLELVRAVESASVYDIRGAAEVLMLGVAEVNRAVMRALAAARQLD
ncbi:EAL and HDOD domain-containing protein [Ideonella sp. A 288]|uniref:EAL and HDOD domain-containing protein n=1 Tax=Ideonella sp. A 288 TaxID=1962181 RepID=UPI000B4BE2E8|nr:HDOD domain-containing protein [Ideonella sp. A 288]